MNTLQRLLFRREIVTPFWRYNSALLAEFGLTSELAQEYKGHPGACWVRFSSLWDDHPLQGRSTIFRRSGWTYPTGHVRFRRFYQWDKV
jgi:hypothetical protein